jgi:heterotetrameric sarcosine oxidase delta subunit
MLLISCPWCGARDESEFSYGGRADALPSLDAGPDAWHSALHVYDNPDGWHDELWFHGMGCGRWLIARRHTRTQQIAETRFPGDRP